MRAHFYNYFAPSAEGGILVALSLGSFQFIELENEYEVLIELDHGHLD